MAYSSKLTFYARWNKQRKSMLGWVSGTQAEIRTGSDLLDGSQIKSSICSHLFKGLCLVVANLLIGQQLSELWHHEDRAHKESGIANMD